MSRSPSLPERPRLNLDPDLSPAERLAALQDHYADVSEVNETLSEQLHSARGRQQRLIENVDLSFDDRERERRWRHRKRRPRLLAPSDREPREETEGATQGAQNHGITPRMAASVRPASP